MENRYITWNDHMTKNLLDGVVSLKFEKKDGTERTMKATLNLEKVPEEQHPKNTNAQYNNTTVQRVYDVDLGAWRSINKDRILSWKAE